MSSARRIKHFEKQRDKELKEQRHLESWRQRNDYYQHWDKKNTKHEEWTSPRYHESQAKLIETMKTKRESELKLETRRSKIRQLYFDDDKQYQIELTLARSRPKTTRRQPDVPTDILRTLNNSLKTEQHDRERQEAELKLYHSWRATNPVLQHYERMQRGRDLKLSWLDQQVELRMRREREEVECHKLLKERDRKLREEEERDRKRHEQYEARKRELVRSLDEQVNQLKERTAQSDRLDQSLHSTRLEVIRLEELEARAKAQRAHLSDRETRLDNLRHYRLRLKEKSQVIQDQLDWEIDFVERLSRKDLIEQVEDQSKRSELAQGLRELHDLNLKQKDLEVTRRRCFDFMFDSEAKLRFAQQDFQWRQEDSLRSNLMSEVLRTIKEQIVGNLEKKRQEQLGLIRDREELLQRVEEYNKEMESLELEDRQRHAEFLKLRHDCDKLAQVKAKHEENVELRRVNEELERTRKEEERLNNEIMAIQRRMGPCKPSAKSRLFIG